MNLIADLQLETLALRILLEHPGSGIHFKEAYFSSPQTGLIYKAIDEANRLNERLDKNLLASKLTRAELLDIAGGVNFIESIFNLDYNEALIEDYAAQLRDLSLRRQTQIDLYTLVQRSPKLDLATISEELNRAQQNLMVGTGISGAEESSLVTLMQLEAKQIYDNAVDNSRFIPVKFKDYDRLIGGIELTNLEIIAARPSMGKSALLLRFLLNIAKQGYGTEIISFEMSNTQLARRALSMETGIPSQRLQQGLVTPPEKDKIREALMRLDKVPFHTAYTSLSTGTALINHIRLAARSKGIKVFGVDYVQLMAVKEGHETLDFANIARGLKAAAKDENIGIYLVSQLNRGVEQRKDKRPTVSDLRQSGGLEENADRIIFPYREAYYNPTDSNRGLCEVIVAKNRNGPLGSFNIMFDEETTNFYEL